MRIGRASRGRIRGQWLGLGVLVGTAVGCIQFDRFQCQDDADCVYEGTPGQCVLNEQTCVYPDDSCDTRWVTASGECRSPAVDGSSGAAPTDMDPSATSGQEGSGSTASIPRDCQNGPYDNVSEVGVVEASSVFSDNYHAFLAADQDKSTSWFSSGPEEGGLPSMYTWDVLEPYCIGRVDIFGNGLHANPAFREDFGFESVIVRVYDQDEEIVFQQMLPMLGTPDPDLFVEPRMVGVRVELELFEHESTDCGGISELEISGFPMAS